MYATFVHDGDAIDYTPGSNVAAGDVVVLLDLVGIARQPIAANQAGALAVRGVFDVAKGGGSILAGATLFWDPTNKIAVTNSNSGTYPRLGNAVKAAATTDTTVRARLNTGISDYQSAVVP